MHSRWQQHRTRQSYGPGRRHGWRNNRGFTLPLIVGITLVVMVITLTLLVVSQGDRLQAATQVSQAGSTAVAEAGVARVLVLFKSLPALSSHNLTDWDTVYTTTTSPTLPTCVSSNTFYSNLVTQSANSLDQRWISLGSDRGEFRVVNYSYDPDSKTGTLQVEGRLRTEGNVANQNTDISNAIAAVRVTVPAYLQVNFGEPTRLAYYPSLWLGHRGITQTPDHAWWQNSAPTTSPLNNLDSISDSGVPTSGGKVLFTYSSNDPKPGTACPDPTPSTEPPFTPVASLSPAPPKIITDSVDSTVLSDRANQAGQGLAVDYTPFRFPKLPPAPAGAILLNPITGNQTLPRAGDSPGGDGRYHYLLQAGSDQLSANLHDQTLTINKPTNLYLLGNMTISGSGRLECVDLCANGTGTGLQIYGNDGTYKLSSDPDGVNLTAEIKVESGGQVVADDLFLFAPLAALTVDASSLAYQNNRGMTWVDQLVLPSGAMAFQQQGENTVAVEANRTIVIRGRTLAMAGVNALPSALRVNNPDVRPVGSTSFGMVVPPAQSGRLPRSTALPVHAWMEEQTRL